MSEYKKLKKEEVEALLALATSCVPLRHREEDVIQELFLGCRDQWDRETVSALVAAWKEGDLPHKKEGLYAGRAYVRRFVGTKEVSDRYSSTWWALLDLSLVACIEPKERHRLDACPAKLRKGLAGYLALWSAGASLDRRVDREVEPYLRGLL